MGDHIDAWNNATGQRFRFGFSDVDPILISHPDCPAISRGDWVGTRILDRSPAKPEVLVYENLEASLPAATAASLRGKIVVVGERNDIELHADAINTLLSGVTIRPAPYSWQFVLTLLMAAAGAYLRYWNPGSVLRRILLAGVVLMYLAGAVILYITSQLLLNTVFHLGAFLLTYLAVGRLQRRFWP